MGILDLLRSAKLCILDDRFRGFHIWKEKIVREQHPENIYRYRKFSEQTIASLCSDELVFSNPAAFNDPLESTFFVETDSNRDTLKEILFTLITRRVKAETKASLKHAHISKEQSFKHAQSVAKNAAYSELRSITYCATNPEYEGSEEEYEKYLLAQEIQKELVKQHDRGICCFSSSYNNPLLWSHYGGEHYGLCIGYNLNRTPDPKLHKVTYGGDCILHTSAVADAILQDNVEAKELIDRTILLNKSKDWEYEQEWRLFSNRGVEQSPLRLTDVTFGLRCPAPIVHAVVKALEKEDRSINFYEVCRAGKNFNLERQELDQTELDVYYPKVARSGLEIFGPIPSE